MGCSILANTRDTVLILVNGKIMEVRDITGAFLVKILDTIHQTNWNKYNVDTKF
jgi:hypothetical protein